MSQENEEMRPEYDIRGGVRGKYFRQYSGGVQLQDAPWIQPQETESNGEHAAQSTIRVGAEPIYLTPRLEVSEPAHR
jgi:hypothetical protein